MQEKQYLGIINRGTLLPLSLVLTLFGGVFWLSALYADVQTLKATSLTERTFKEDVIDRLARIEQALKQRERK